MTEDTLRVRVTAAEMAQLKARARSVGKSLSNLVRAELDLQQRTKGGARTRRAPKSE